MSSGSRTQKRLTGVAETRLLSAKGQKGLKSESKGVEVDLEEPLEQFYALLEEAPIGICNTDLKGKITYVNKRFEEVSGYSRREVVSKNGFKLGLFSAGTLGLLAKRLKEGMGGSPPPILEAQFKCKDGRWIWVEMKGRVLKKKGTPVGFQVIAGAIDESKRAEEALRAEKDKLQSIISSIEYGISIVDKDYNLLYQSQPSARDGNYHLGEKCYRAFEGREDVCDDCPVAKAFADGESHTAERKIIQPSGEVLYAESTASPLKNEEGEIISCLEVSHDITERKQMNKALQAEKDKLQSIIDAMEYGLDIRDKEYNIIYQNERSRKTFGGSHVGEKCYKVYEGRDTLCPDCPVKKAFEDGKSHTAERKMVSPSGEVVYWDNVASPVRDAKGEITSCIELLKDITDRKLVEQALQVEKDKLQTVIDALGYGLNIQDRDYNIIYQNEVSRKISGGSHLGEKCYRAFENHETICDDCPVEKAFKDGKSHATERRVVLDSGRVIYWENIVSPVRDARGKIVACIEVVKDVTKRKQAEEKLRESEASLVEAQEVANMGSWSMDVATGEGTWSAEMFRLTGFAPSQGVPSFEEFLDWVHPEDREYFRWDFHEGIKQTGQSATFEFRSNPEKGPVRDILTNVSAVLDSKGRSVKMMGTLQDITERKRMEEVLRASEEELQKMFESVTDGIWVIDLKGVITKVNDSAVAMHGFSSKEGLVGRNAIEFIAPADHVRIKKNVQEVIKSGVAKDGEYTMLKADGSEFPGELSTNALRDAEGNCIGHITVSRDVTERKRVEAELRESEERYRRLFESTHDMVQSVAPDGHFIFVNQAWLKTMGYTEAELPNLNLFEIIHPDSLPHCRETFSKIMAGEEVPDFQATLVAKDGRSVLVEGGGVACYVDDKLYVTQGIFRDITERKQAEEELKLRAQMLDVASDSIFVHDGKRFIYVNEAACRAHGYSREEFLEMNLLQIIPEEQRGNIAANEHREMQGEREVTLEVDHICKDGSLMPVEVRSRIIMLGDKKLVLAIARDITERKRVETELKLRAQMLDGATDAIFIHDFDENFFYVNEAACRLFGYSREEFSKLKVYQLSPPEQVYTVSSLQKDILGKGELVFEIDQVRKDGSLFPVEVHSRTIESGGQKFILAVVRDITGRKRAEAERSDLEQKAHLASRLASVGEMASGIAHEINNPLTAVIGFSQLLMDADIPDDTREDIAIIHKEAQRAAGVARNLLTFARKHAPSKQATDLNDIIEGVLKLRAYEQNVSNIQIKTKLAPDLPEVLGDYSQLQQVFINLILNAEAAMLDANNGGTLSITTQKVNGIVRASFADNGPGITAENLKKIFDPFFTTKEVGKGTGLGLSVCHGIITEHNGKIYAKSKEGSGATFVVELPISS